jgi:hypothetical protein
MNRRRRLLARLARKHADTEASVLWWPLPEDDGEGRGAARGAGGGSADGGQLGDESSATTDGTHTDGDADGVLTYTVSVHVRRGDYLSKQVEGEFALPDGRYYERAMREVEMAVEAAGEGHDRGGHSGNRSSYSYRYHYLLFSDDVDYAARLPCFAQLTRVPTTDPSEARQAQGRAGAKQTSAGAAGGGGGGSRRQLRRLLTVVEEPRDHIVLQLMSMCDQHIIAPSSFSWWGAFLAGTTASAHLPDASTDARLGVVVAPRPWFGPKLASSHSSEQLMLPQWKVVDWDTEAPTLAEIERANKQETVRVNVSALIDKVYVINLVNRQDRREHMRRELQRHGLLHKAEFVPAVEVRDIDLYRQHDGDEVPGEGRGRYPHAAPMPNWQNVSDPFRYYSRKLRPAEVATSLSHRLAWTRMQSRMDDVAASAPLLPSLVLEDDALLRDDFNTELPLLLERLPIDWRLLYLFRVPVIAQLDTVLDEWLVRPHYSYSALAYLLHPLSAPRLLDRFNANMHRIIPSDEFLPAMFIQGGHPRAIVQEAYGTGDGLLEEGGGAYSVASYLVTDVEVLASNSSIDCCASDVISALYVVDPALGPSLSFTDRRRRWDEEVKTHPGLDKLTRFVGSEDGAVWKAAADRFAAEGDRQNTSSGVVVMVVEARAALGRWIDRDLSTVLDAAPLHWDVLLLGTTAKAQGAAAVNDYIIDPFSSASTPSATQESVFAYLVSGSGLRLLASQANSESIEGGIELLRLLRQLHQVGTAKVYAVSPQHTSGLVRLR